MDKRTISRLSSRIEKLEEKIEYTDSGKPRLFPNPNHPPKTIDREKLQFYRFISELVGNGVIVDVKSYREHANRWASENNFYFDKRKMNEHYYTFLEVRRKINEESS